MPDSRIKKAENRTISGFTKEEQGKWTEPYIFVHAADPQLGFIDEKGGGQGLVWDQEIDLTKKAIDAVNRMEPRPKFLFINGDLVHAYPGTGPHKKKQCQDLIDVLAKSEVPVMVTSGNHDIGITPTPRTVSDFVEWFGDDYFSFYVGGVFYIALNSQFFFDSSETEDLVAKQLVWMRDQLQRAKSEDATHVIVFMHIPPFTSHPDEDNAFSNVPKKFRSMLLKEFAEAGVEFVFSGHWHRNGGGPWTATSDDGRELKIEVVITTAIGMQLGNDRSGFTVVTVKKDEILPTYYALDDVPQKLPL